MSDAPKIDNPRLFRFRLEPDERQPLFTHGSPAELEVAVDATATLIYETASGDLGLRTVQPGEECRVVARRLHIHAERETPVSGHYRVQPVLSVGEGHE